VKKLGIWMASKQGVALAVFCIWTGDPYAPYKLNTQIEIWEKELRKD